MYWPRKRARLRYAGSMGSAVPQGTNGSGDFKRVSPCQIRAVRPKRRLAVSHRRWKRASFSYAGNIRRWAQKSSIRSWKTWGTKTCPACERSTTSSHAIISSARLQVWLQPISSALKRSSPMSCGRRISKEISPLPTASAAIR